jgi:hypothetical protein
VREALSPGVLARAVLQPDLPLGSEALVEGAGAEEIPPQRQRQAAAAAAEPTAAAAAAPPTAAPENERGGAVAWVIRERDFKKNPGAPATALDATTSSSRPDDRR